MPQFLLLLYNSPAAVSHFKSLSPEEMQKALEKYMAWAKKPFGPETSGGKYVLKLTLSKVNPVTLE